MSWRLPLFAIACILPGVSTVAAAERDKSPSNEAATPVPGPRVPKVIKLDELARIDDGSAAALDRLRKNMRRIILPKVTIDEMPLSGAIEHLKVLSARYDSKSAQGDRGVQILLNSTGTLPEVNQPIRLLPDGTVEVPSLEETPDPFGGVEPDPIVSYSARNVSLYDAVVAVALRGRYHVRVEPYVVVLTPTPQRILFAREYLVPPGLFQSSRPPDGEPPKFSTEWKTPDPNENLATYIARTNRLIARGDEAFHRDVWSKIDKGWRDYYAAQKRKK